MSLPEYKVFIEKSNMLIIGNQKGEFLMIHSFQKRWSIALVLSLLMLVMIMPSVFAEDIANATATITLPVAGGNPVRTGETGEPEKYTIGYITICEYGQRIWCTKRLCFHSWK